MSYINKYAHFIKKYSDYYILIILYIVNFFRISHNLYFLIALQPISCDFITKQELHFFNVTPVFNLLYTPNFLTFLTISTPFLTIIYTSCTTTNTSTTLTSINPRISSAKFTVAATLTNTTTRLILSQNS